jgi:hypothetical protein
LRGNLRGATGEGPLIFKIQASVPATAHRLFGKERDLLLPIGCPRSTRRHCSFPGSEQPNVLYCDSTKSWSFAALSFVIKIQLTVCFSGSPVEPLFRYLSASSTAIWESFTIG